MSVQSQKYIVQNIERLTFLNLANGACYFIADDLQEANMSNEQETVYALGKNGVKIGSGDRNKASKITATNGAIIDGIMAAQTGSGVETGTHVVRGFLDDCVVFNGGNGLQATLKHKPAGRAGAEIKFVYKKNLDGTLGKPYPIGATAGADTFSYSSAKKTVNIPTDGNIAEGDHIVAIYDIEVANAKKILNADNKFSTTGMLVADIYAKDICTEQSYCGKIIYPKAKASGNFELAFGNDPSVQAMEFEALAGGCGAGNNHTLWELYIFDEEDAVK